MSLFIYIVLFGFFVLQPMSHKNIIYVGILFFFSHYSKSQASLLATYQNEEAEKAMGQPFVPTINSAVVSLSVDKRGVGLP